MFGYRLYITTLLFILLCHFGNNQKLKKRPGRRKLLGFSKHVIRLHIFDSYDNSTFYASATVLSGISMITSKSVLPKQYVADYSSSGEDWYSMKFFHEESGGILNITFGDTVVHPKTDLVIIRTKENFLEEYTNISAINYKTGRPRPGMRAFIVGDQYYREFRFATTTTVITTRRWRRKKKKRTTVIYDDSCSSDYYYCSRETRTPPWSEEDTTTPRPTTTSLITYRTPTTVTRKHLLLLRRRPKEDYITISRCPRYTRLDMVCSFTHNMTLPNEEDVGGPLITKDGNLIGVITRQRFITFVSSIVYIVDISYYRRWITANLRVRKKRKRKTTTTKKRAPPTNRQTSLTKPSTDEEPSSTITTNNIGTTPLPGRQTSLTKPSSTIPTNKIGTTPSRVVL